TTTPSVDDGRLGERSEGTALPPPCPAVPLESRGCPRPGVTSRHPTPRQDCPSLTGMSFARPLRITVTVTVSPGAWLSPPERTSSPLRPGAPWAATIGSAVGGSRRLTTAPP